MNVTPRNDYILVRRVRPAAMSAGGLHIPDSAQEKGMENRIEAIGPGAFLPAGKRCSAAVDNLKVGQRVLISKYGGVAVEGDPELFLVREGEIIGILDDAAGAQPAQTKEKR